MLLYERVTGATLRAGDPLVTRETLRSAMLRVGRNEQPRLLLEVHLSGLLDASAARWAVPFAWSAAEFPQRCLTQADWRALFHLAGYTVDGQDKHRPSDPLTLYRGAPYRFRRRWSWTSDPVVAERFMVNRDAQHGTEDSRVWRAEVKPWRLFAQITENRTESEYVVDTKGLRIVEHHVGAVAAAVAQRVARLKVREVAPK